MPYQRDRNLMTPDFYPDAMMPEWQNMGDDQQVNISPAVGAFKQRFMGNKGVGNTPNPGMGDVPEMDSMMEMPANAGGAPMKRKSL